MNGWTGFSCNKFNDPSDNMEIAPVQSGAGAIVDLASQVIRPTGWPARQCRNNVLAWTRDSRIGSYRHSAANTYPCGTALAAELHALYDGTIVLIPPEEKAIASHGVVHMVNGHVHNIASDGQLEFNSCMTQRCSIHLAVYPPSITMSEPVV